MYSVESGEVLCPRSYRLQSLPKSFHCLLHISEEAWLSIKSFKRTIFENHNNYTINFLKHFRESIRKRQTYFALFSWVVVYKIVFADISTNQSNNFKKLTLHYVTKAAWKLCSKIMILLYLHQYNLSNTIQNFE